MKTLRSVTVGVFGLKVSRIRSKNMMFPPSQHHGDFVVPLMKRRRQSLDSELEMQPRGVCINSVAFTSSGESFHHSALLANISKRRDIIISVPLWLLELPRQIYQAVALGQKWETWGKWWLVLGASAVTAGVQVGPTRQANSAYPCQSFSPFHKPH